MKENRFIGEYEKVGHEKLTEDEKAILKKLKKDSDEK
jgi:hypothetical protein